MVVGLHGVFSLTGSFFGFPITMIFAFFLLYVCTITIGSNFSHVTNVGVDLITRLVEGLM